MSIKTRSLIKAKKLQRISIILLDEFIRVCNEHNLRWFIDAGSLLGVIRHGGFIPWDDDIDVVMPREDYNILYENGDNWFKEPFYFYTSKKLKAVSLTAKLKYTDSTAIHKENLNYFYRKNDKNFDFNFGIGMDIEPIDHVPNERPGRICLMHNLDFLYQNSLSFNRLCKTEAERYLILDKIRDAAETFNETMSHIDSLFSNFIACTPWWQFNNSRGKFVSSNCYDSYIEKTFEGCKQKVRVPIGYDDILKSYYGDYMKEVEDYCLYDNVIIDDERSYKYYEQFTNEEILKMIKEENKNGD